MTFAFMTIHPIKMDGIPRPGSQRGLPTNEVDTEHYVHACGSDGFLRLDGRCGRVRQLMAVMDYIHSHRKIHKFDGFEIHVGEIRKSRAVACYRVTGYHESRHEFDANNEPVPVAGPPVATGFSYQSIPLSKAAPN